MQEEDFVKRISKKKLVIQVIVNISDQLFEAAKAKVFSATAESNVETSLPVAETCNVFSV